MNLISVLRVKIEHCEDCYYYNNSANPSPGTIGGIKKICIKLDEKMSDEEVLQFIRENCFNSIWVKDPIIYDNESDYELD
jgi:hypothetical protein